MFTTECLLVETQKRRGTPQGPLVLRLGVRRAQGLTDREKKEAWKGPLDAGRFPGNGKTVWRLSP